MHIEYRYSFTIIAGNCGLHVCEPYHGTKDFWAFFRFVLFFLNIFDAGLAESIDVELAEVLPSSCCILRS